MFIIWGFRNILRKIASGEFFCPQCNQDRTYELKAIRRFLTIFFIPVLPLGREKGKVVVCSTCNGQFYESVLERKVVPKLTAGVNDLQRTVLAYMATLSGNSAASRQAAIGAMGNLGVVSYSDADLTTDQSLVTDDKVVESAKALRSSVSAADAERVVSYARHVASADGPLDEIERGALTRLGMELGMTELHIQGVLAG